MFAKCVFLNGAVKKGGTKKTASPICMPLEKWEIPAVGEAIGRLLVILVGNHSISSV